jgi:hypothetical protein
MILLFALAISFVWAYLRGGRLGRLATFPLRGAWLVLAALAIQSAVVYVTLPIDLPEPIRVGLLALSYALLVVFVWWNRRTPGMWLLGAGVIANWLVTLVNGGYMPVTYEALAAAGRGHLVNGTEVGTLVSGSKDVLLPREMTNLWFLSDIFVIPPPFPFSSVFSVGDVLIALGLFLFVPAALGAQTRTRSAGTLPTS